MEVEVELEATSQGASLRTPLLDAEQWSADEGALDLWLSVLGEVAPEELCLLAEDERARAERQRGVQRSASATFAAARIALRRVLCRYVGGEPSGIAFRYGTHGRPALLGDASLDFNLSHSGSFALIAVAREARVGVDLQRIEPARDLRGLARRFFAAEERASLDALEGAAFARAFFRLWCCKEAYLKALGTAISVLPSTSFCFRIDEAPGERPRLVRSAWDAAGAAPLRDWRFELLDAPDGFVAAVGWSGGALRLRAFGCSDAAT